jgi:DNA-binding beta-propeller fold protein YncE
VAPAAVVVAAGPVPLTFLPVPLPGARAPASLDYLAYEGARARVWVPVGDTGSVDVYDPSGGSFTRVDGFETGERAYKGKTRTTGPSAVAIGEGFAYVGNRATSQVCAVDTARLTLGKCVKLSAPTDGVAYVAAVKEVWVTTPRARAIVVLDASRPDTLKAKATIQLDGEPEGYAGDVRRGLFFTNLEDRNETVVLDVKTHRPTGAFPIDCGSDGPRGVAADSEHGLIFVACTDHVLVLDGSHGGVTVATLDTGAGLDNIDWLAPPRLLYAAAGKGAKVTIARIDANGRPTVVATGASVAGARNGVADASGNAYVADPANARLLVFPFAP